MRVVPRVEHSIRAASGFPVDLLGLRLADSYESGVDYYPTLVEWTNLLEYCVVALALVLSNVARRVCV